MAPSSPKSHPCPLRHRAGLVAALMAHLALDIPVRDPCCYLLHSVPWSIAAATIKHRKSETEALADSVSRESPLTGSQKVCPCSVLTLESDKGANLTHVTDTPTCAPPRTFKLELRSTRGHELRPQLRVGQDPNSTRGACRCIRAGNTSFPDKLPSCCCPKPTGRDAKAYSRLSAL